jgi:hypothetical protein
VSKDHRGVSNDVVQVPDAVPAAAMGVRVEPPPFGKPAPEAFLEFWPPGCRPIGTPTFHDDK